MQTEEISTIGDRHAVDDFTPAVGVGEGGVITDGVEDGVVFKVGGDDWTFEKAEHELVGALWSGVDDVKSIGFLVL